LFTFCNVYMLLLISSDLTFRCTCSSTLSSLKSPLIEGVVLDWEVRLLLS